jgi:hypothetical protein
MPKPNVLLFVDNSNIFISAKNVALTKEGRHAKDNVRISFENLLKLALAGRTLKKAYVIGSIPPEQKAVWEKLEAATGVKPELYERGANSGGEQGLDQCLQVHMLRAISDNPEPQVAVVMTGDGAGYDDGIGFHADMARMHESGWGIEVISWEASCKRTLKKWASANGVFVPLESHYDAITFIEGGRHAKSSDFSTRPTSTPRLSPAQRAEQEARRKLEAELERLKAENDLLKNKKEKRSKGKAKYAKRVQNQNR